jgi:hypothetical protein
VLAAAFLGPLRELRLQRSTSLATQGKLPEWLVLPAALIDTFLLNQLVCTSIDYGTGMVANRNFELWDYRDMPFNFQGQICLQNSLFYSLLATWAVWRLIPHIDDLLAGTPDDVLDAVLAGAGSFFVFLELIYHVLPPKESASEASGAEESAPEASE